MHSTEPAHPIAPRRRLVPRLLALKLLATRLLAALAATASLALAACETIADADDLPYVERLVVEGFVTADSAVRDIRISRTLPLGTRIVPESLWVTDAEAWLATPGGRVALVHTGSGMYAAPGTVMRSGDSCSLHVEWRGRRVDARTRIPIAPELLDVQWGARFLLEGTEYFYDSLQLIVRPRDPNAVVGGTLLASNDGLSYHTVISYGFASWRGGGGLARLGDTLADGTWPAFAPGETFVFDPTFARLGAHAFDYPFYEFFMTSNGDRGEGIFENPTQPHWNVHGDGIGMFVGHAVTTRPFPP